MSPLNQLNLVLWMSWPRPAPTGGIRPLLHEQGYRVWGIGPRLSVNPSHSIVARGAGLPIKESVAPEVVLQNVGSRRTLIVECKMSGFAPDPDPTASERSQRGHQSRQATSLLLITGDEVAKYAGFSEPALWGGSLLYIVEEGQELDLEATLDVLGERIERTGLGYQAASAAGLYQRDDGLYFVPASTTPHFAISGSGGVRVMETQVEDAGDVLQLIPLLPYDTSIEAPTDTQKQATEERLRSAVASMIGRQIGRHPFEFTLEGVLQETVEVWSMWRDDEPRRKFRKVARAYVKAVVLSLERHVRASGHQVIVSYSTSGDRWQWESVSTKVAGLVRRALASVAFQKGRIDLWEMRQGDLFDQR